MAGPGSPRSLASYATAGFVLFLFLMAAMQSLRQPPVPPPTRSRRPASHVAVPKDSKRSCNPYNFPGVLKLRQNSREPFENGYEWTVLGQVPPQCRPHGSLFRDFVAGNPHSRVRNRRVVILGDSVTRYVVQVARTGITAWRGAQSESASSGDLQRAEGKADGCRAQRTSQRGFYDI